MSVHDGAFESAAGAGLLTDAVLAVVELPLADNMAPLLVKGKDPAR